MFLAHERDPPRFGEIPETASAILWIQELLSKITYPMEKMKGNLSSKEIEVCERFKKTEHLLKSYQQKKYENWKSAATEKMNQFLHTNILKRLEIKSNVFDDKINYDIILFYKVNFPIYLEELSTDAKLLENFGYDIPNFIKNVILQERVFYRHRNRLRNILEDLKHSYNELEEEEISVMKVPISDLCALFEPGLNRFSWESTEIVSFLKNIEQGVDVFRGLVSQVKNIVFEVDSRIKLLSTCDLFQFKNISSPITTCETYFNDAQSEMESKVDKLVQIHNSIDPLLKNLERITCKTTTGTSPHLRQYLMACEEKILQALVEVMLNNLEYLEEELLQHFIFPYISLSYKSENELVRSSFTRVKLVFVIFMQNAIESTRKMLRWLDGSCIPSSPFYCQQLKQKMEFSYYLDLSMHPDIKKIVLLIMKAFFVFVDNLESNTNE